MDCKEMLKENFVWAAKGKINSYSTATVFVTLTRHTYTRKKPDNNHKPDTVIYANGPLTLAYIPHMPTNKVLKGHVKAWINNEKSYKQSPFVLTPDIFPEMNGSYFDFTITPTGQVTIQFLSNGISDTPKPLSFETECMSGILVAVYDNLSNSTSSYSISFTNGEQSIFNT